jgi:hypothetical protein
MSEARREPAGAVRAGQASGPETVEAVGVGEGADVDGVSTFAAAAFALEERRVARNETAEAAGMFVLRTEPRRGARPRAAAAAVAAGRDERTDDDASAAVEKERRIVLLVLLLLLLAVPNRVVAVGNARSWLQRRARRPRHIQRWRRPARVWF